MLDRERILAKVDELDGYLRELEQVVPDTFAAYRSIEKRRSCERLLQLAIECVIDICALFVSGLRLGLPAEEDDLFEKLEAASLISGPTRETLRSMRGFRNILVHEYGKKATSFFGRLPSCNVSQRSRSRATASSIPRVRARDIATATG